MKGTINTYQDRHDSATISVHKLGNGKAIANLCCALRARLRSSPIKFCHTKCLDTKSYLAGEMGLTNAVQLSALEPIRKYCRASQPACYGRLSVVLYKYGRMFRNLINAVRSCCSLFTVQYLGHFVMYGHP